MRCSPTHCPCVLFLPTVFLHNSHTIDALRNKSPDYPRALVSAKGLGRVKTHSQGHKRNLSRAVAEVRFGRESGSSPIAERSHRLAPSGHHDFAKRCFLHSRKIRIRPWGAAPGTISVRMTRGESLLTRLTF